MKPLIALILLPLFVPTIALESGEDAVKAMTAITPPVDSVTIYTDGPGIGEDHWMHVYGPGNP